MIELFFRLVRIPLSYLVLAFEWLSPGRLEFSRTPEQQAAVNEQAKSLQLYQFPACPFCVKVRRELRRLGVSLPLVDATAGTPAAETLVKHGGELQVPCLRIEEPNGGVRWMYESDQINAYLRTRFGAPA